MAEAKRVEAIVAKGRTVCGEGGKCFSPGDKVKLSTEEVSFLRVRGFLDDPNGVVVPVGDGPQFGVSEGPTITGAL